jgi:hypothetical protein
MHALLDHALEHTIRKGPIKDINSTFGERGHVTVKSDYKTIGHGGDTAEQVRHCSFLLYFT